MGLNIVTHLGQVCNVLAPLCTGGCGTKSDISQQNEAFVIPLKAEIGIFPIFDSQFLYMKKGNPSKMPKV